MYVKRARLCSLCACGAWFEHRNPVATSCDACVRKRQKVRAKARGYKNPSKRSRGPFKCRTCEREYFTDKRPGQGEKYCSRECAFIDQESWQSRGQSIAAEYRAHLRRGYRFDACRTCAVRVATVGAHCSQACRDATYWRRHVKGSVIRCDVCGVVFSPLHLNQGRTACSDECVAVRKRRYNRELQRRFGGSQMSRARKRGCARERVDRISIFERDGWRCQACGAETPRALMGTNDDDAPELDHKVPLSKGGGHVKDNVHTLCRVCNCLKGAMKWEEFIATWVRAA